MVKLSFFVIPIKWLSLHLLEQIFSFLKAPMCACRSIYNFKLHLLISILLLGFSKTCKLWSSKAAFTVAINHNKLFQSCTSNEPWNTETYKMDQNPPITNHKPWPFETVEVNFCFLRGNIRWLTAAKNANVSWLLNFRICVFMKSAVTLTSLFRGVILLHSARHFCFEVTVLIYKQ